MFGTVQQGFFLVAGLAILGLAIFAFVNCLRWPNEAFIATGKRTKNFWLGMTGGSAGAMVLVFLGFVPIFSLMIQIAALIASVVYLVDVRPQLKEIMGR
jgi:hypothetical protein